MIFLLYHIQPAVINTGTLPMTTIPSTMAPAGSRALHALSAFAPRLQFENQLQDGYTLVSWQIPYKRRLMQGL